MLLFKKKTLSAAMALALASTAQAQGDFELLEGEGFSLEEIVIIATKRETLLGETPIAVTALQGFEFDQKLIRDVDDLQLEVPNLHVLTNAFESSLVIRGVASSTSGAAAFHRDGVFVSRGVNAQGEFFDVERIEVLRGPQGTLYGRNSTAGAVNVISRKADVEASEAGLDVQVGDYDLRRTRGFVNMPFGDSAAGRLAFNYAERDGYQENLTFPGTGDDSDAVDEWALRPQLVLNPSANLELQFIAEIFRSDTNPTGARPLIDSETLLDVDLDLSSIVPGLVIPDIYALGGASGVPSDPSEIYANHDDSFGGEVENDRYYASATLQLPNLAGGAFTKLILGRLESERDTRIETDGSDANFLVANQFFESEQTVFEWQLGSANDGALEWLVGVNYFTDEGSGYVPIDFIFNDVDGIPLSFVIPGIGDIFAALRGSGGNRQDNTELTSSAVFGQATYDMTPSFSAILGLRYTKDEVDDTYSQVQSPVLPPLAPVSNDASWSEVTGNLGFEWRVSGDDYVYGTLARGFNSGGFNAVTGVGPVPVDPEFIDSLELGSKHTMLDARLQINLAAFYSEYTDLNIIQVVGATSLTDTGGAEITGLELEWSYLPVADLKLSGFVGWLDTEVVDFDFTDPVSGESVVLNGNQLPRAPELQALLSVEYEWVFAGGATLTPSVDIYWQDEVFYGPDNRSDLVGDSYSKSDFTLTWRSGDERYAVEAFVENIEDEQQVVALATSFAQLGSFPLATYSAPRTYGLRFSSQWGG